MRSASMHVKALSIIAVTLRIKAAIAYSLLLVLCCSGQSVAVNRLSAASGNFNQPSTWNPAGIPAEGDQLTIQNGHTVNISSDSETGQLIISNGGKLTFSPAQKLTVYGNFTVYGIAEIVDGDIDLKTPGTSFTIGATGSLTWSPANNTSTGATLFTNGIEFFHPASTLIIKKWYNYSSVPLGSVVTGNFGNVTLNTLTNGLLYEWNQDNEFETHVILGTLTIDQGWVTLDKSGSISSTTIGAIYMNNINSYLDIHTGNHPGSFSLTTSSITNIGGKINGIYNGEGNIHLQVNGEFTNLGNVELIYNSGIAGIGNGNASMQVTGKYYQTTGDFRGIFNLSSSTSGKVNLEFGSMKLTGGIFMGHYACHSAGNISTMKINGDLEIDFASPNAKFRGNGLTTLSGNNNNLSMLLTIEGNLIVRGPQAAEFTSSGSTGPETTIIKGTSRFEGCTSNFNYGSHSTTLSMLDNLDINGGTVYLSRTNGSLTALLNKNLNLQNGNLSISGGTGNSNMIVNGDYYQTGGSLFFHNNNTVPTPNIIYVTIHGNFHNQSGNLTFDNNTASSAQHYLSLNGEYFTIGGNAVINSMVSAVNPKYGVIYFDRQGMMQYLQNTPGVQFRYVKQIINANCSLKIVSGNMQVAESIQSASDMLHVSGNAVLDLVDQQLYGNNLNLYTSVMVDEDARIRISNQNGLYNGTSSAAINATGNMQFTLHEKSIIEYYGSKAQTITGTGLGNATTVNQQYGILEINKSSKPASLNGNQVIVRTELTLAAGELNLNNFNLTINSGTPSAINALDGYIRSEGNSTGTSSMVKWKNIASGTHMIPFGKSPDDLLPFSFTPVSGFGNEFAVSTRSTGSENRPLTNGVVHLNYSGSEAGNKKVIDRWYHVTAPGVKANITASYLGDENTVMSDLYFRNFSFIGWNGMLWKLLGGTGNGTLNGTGAVSCNGISTWGPILMISNVKLEAADILEFNATLTDDRVALDWTAIANVAPEKYTIERSEDGNQFTDLFEKMAEPASASPLNYQGTDNHPLPGISFYRLKQHQPDGNLKYSQAVKIVNQKSYTQGLEFISVSPNPFTTGFTAWYQVPEETEIEIKLTSSGGQVVYSNITRKSEGKNSFVYSDGEKLAPGIYILTISNGRSYKNYKLFNI